MIRDIVPTDLVRISEKVEDSLFYYEKSMGKAGVEERSRLSRNAKRIIEKRLGLSYFDCVGIFEGFEMKGFLISRSWSEECLELYWLVIFRQYQNKGLATELFEKMCNGKKNIFLTVHPKNSQALSLYKKLGFRSTQRYTRRHRNAREYYTLTNSF